MEDNQMDLTDIDHGLSVLDLYCSVHEVYGEEETKASSKERRRKSSGPRRKIAPSALKKKMAHSRKRSSDYRQRSNSSSQGKHVDITRQINVRSTPHRKWSRSGTTRRHSVGTAAFNGACHTLLREKNHPADDHSHYSLRSPDNHIKGAVESASSPQEHCQTPFDASVDPCRRNSMGETVYRKTSFETEISGTAYKRFRKSVCFSHVHERQ